MQGRVLSSLTLVILLASPAWSFAQAFSASDRAIASDADTLVQQAVSADKAGDKPRREALLKQAIKVDPHNELARWLLGQVQFSQGWSSIEEVEELVAKDGRWEEYRRRVKQSDNSVNAHVALAQWCIRARLKREERWHWQQVLEQAPYHPEALERLDLVWHEEQLYTKAELAELREAKSKYRNLKPKFDHLVRQALSNEETRRTNAVEQLAAVDDPGAIPALSAALRMDNGHRESLVSDLYPAEAGLLIERIHEAGVEALSKMDQYEATVKLVEVAVLSDYPLVRQSATRALIGRPKTDYMPLLMDGMKPPLQLTIDHYAGPNGSKVTEELYEVGREADRKLVRTSDYSSVNYLYGRRTGELRIEKDPEGDRARSNQHVMQTHRWFVEENKSRQHQNERIQEVLTSLTGYDLDANPEQWWETWADYNEYDRSIEKPTYNFSETQSFPILRRGFLPSCFTAGTPIWTQGGPKPIEHVEVGDFVLSQDPVSGRLDYRPVIETTVRPPSPVNHIGIEGETITATLGHRFWVTGHGWRMAKFLKPGYLLYSTQGSTELISIEEGTDTEAFNLVVDDFHTYFVGNHQLLVHDNELPEHSLTVVPGVELSPEAPGPAPVVTR